MITLTGFGAGTSRSSINLFQRFVFEAIFRRAYQEKDRQKQKIKAS